MILGCNLPSHLAKASILNITLYKYCQKFLITSSLDGKKQNGDLCTESYCQKWQLEGCINRNHCSLMTIYSSLPSGFWKRYFRFIDVTAKRSNYHHLLQLHASHRPKNITQEFLLCAHNCRAIMSFRMLSTFDLKTSNYREPSKETKLKVGLYNNH